MHKTYEELKDMLNRELKEITRHGELDDRSLELTDKITHSIKSIDTILAMEDYDRGSSRGHVTVHRDREYDDGRSYEHRDSMGRYSRDAANDELMESLREYMHDTSDPEKKQEIKRFMRKLGM